MTFQYLSFFFFCNIINSAFFSIVGQPELCIDNNTDGSQLTYTVCGFPVPNVIWGFTKEIINNSVNATKRNDLYYAHDYTLSIKPNMCAKVLHFKAVGYKDITISWTKKVQKDCKFQLY